MYAKEGINESLLAGGMDPTAAGVLAGASIHQGACTEDGLAVPVRVRS